MKVFGDKDKRQHVIAANRTDMEKGKSIGMMRQKSEERFYMNGKKLVRGTILTVLCMVGILYLNGTVSKAYWVVVKSDNTRVRNAASTDSEVMTAVNAGDRLDVYSEEQGADGKTWYKVSINNVSGYVRSDTVEKASEGDAELTSSDGGAQTEPAASSSVESMPSQAATVKQDDVNVRSEASTNGSVVAKLPQGAAVTLTGTSSDSSGKTWYQVNFINNGSNVTGYIREDYVEPGEVVAQDTPEESAEGGEDELADMYGDMPTEDGAGTQNNDYELFFEADQEGVDCWYIHDNVAQKRYKLEQLMQADEMNTHNLEIKDRELGKMKIAVIILAVLFVFSLLAAGFFGFKYHDIKDGDDDDDDDDDDDFREAPPVRRRPREEAERGSRSREVSRSDVRAARPAQHRPETGTQRRTSTASGTQRRPETAEARSAKRPTQTRRPETEAPRRPAAAAGTRTRSPQPTEQVRRTPAAQEKAAPRSSSRGDVEWKSKNFLAGDDDELDFSFIDMDDDV